MDEREDAWGSYVHRPQPIMLYLIREFQELHGADTGTVCLTLAYDGSTHILHCLCPLGFWMLSEPLALLCGATKN